MQYSPFSRLLVFIESVKSSSTKSIYCFNDDIANEQNLYTAKRQRSISVYAYVCVYMKQYLYIYWRAHRSC